MFEHCGQKFKPTDIWYLKDNENFYNRVLYITSCPKCLITLTCLIETSKTENRTFGIGKIKSGKKAIKEMELCRFDTIYTNNDFRIEKGRPYGWVYGENKEIKNRKGEVIAIRQKAVDYFGQKEIVKTVKVHNR